MQDINSNQPAFNFYPNLENDDKILNNLNTNPTPINQPTSSNRQLDLAKKIFEARTSDRMTQLEIRIGQLASIALIAIGITLTMGATLPLFLLAGETAMILFLTSMFTIGAIGIGTFGLGCRMVDYMQKNQQLLNEEKMFWESLVNDSLEKIVENQIFLKNYDKGYINYLGDANKKLLTIDEFNKTKAIIESYKRHKIKLKNTTKILDPIDDLNKDFEKLRSDIINKNLQQDFGKLTSSGNKLPKKSTSQDYQTSKETDSVKSSFTQGTSNHAQSNQHSPIQMFPSTNPPPFNPAFTASAPPLACYCGKHICFH